MHASGSAGHEKKAFPKPHFIRLECKRWGKREMRKTENWFSTTKDCRKDPRVESFLRPKE